MPIRTNVHGRSGGVGSVKFFPGIETPPEGYILADGSVHDFGEFPALDAAWGVTADTLASNIPERLAFANMTAATTGEQTASASSLNAANYAAWKPFQTSIAADRTDTWVSGAAPTSASPQWLQLTFANTEHFLTRFRIQARMENTNPSATAQPRIVLLQGSDDGIGFFDLTEQITIPEMETGGITDLYKITKNNRYYKVFRLVVYDRYSTNAYVCIGRLQLLEGSLPGTYTLPALVDLTDSGIYCVKTS